jgi:hypothetical protein
MKPSRYEAVSRVFPDQVACLDLRLFQAFAEQGGAAHALGRTVPRYFETLCNLFRRHARSDAMSAQTLPNLNVIDCHHRLLSDFFFK